jgi:hypothetical protein
MRLVAVCARLAPGVGIVLGRSLRVTGRTIGDDRGLMRAMARLARNRCVVHDGLMAVLGLRVAIDTGSLLRRRHEAMTPEATRRVAQLASVPPFDLLGVTVRAPGRAGVLEPLAREVVATTAFDLRLVHVGHVPGA